MADTNIHDVVCFGEVLWDILPDGAVPGGAPMNVAYQLHKLHKNPTLITCIGLDEEGKKLKDIFIDHGVNTDYFQTDPAHETGKVFAKPNELNEVVYDIVMPSAWDFIQWDDRFPELISKADYFVFGSLAARNEVSKQTLLQLLELAQHKILDINLRAPHFSQPLVEELLGKADMLKLNIAELDLITSWFGLYTTTDEKIKALGVRFSIPEIVVTLGGEGAVYYTNENIYRHPGFKVKVVDTVGSGDAFLAGLLSKKMENAAPETALDFANSLGAFTATKKGACPPYSMAELESFIKMQHGEK